MIALVIGLLFLATAADAANTEIWNCNQRAVTGRAKLMQDLDCSGSLDRSVVIDRGSLDLNGYTLVGGDNYAVFCSGSCKVFGPGTIAGDGSGIHAQKTLKVIDVDVALTGGIGAATNGNLILDGVSITGAVNGAIGRNVKLIDTTVAAQANGVLSGGTGLGETCQRGALLLRRSSVTTTNPGLCVGTDPAQNCADVLSCKPPKLSASTCGTSCRGGTGVPCESWGACSAD